MDRTSWSWIALVLIAVGAAGCLTGGDERGRPASSRIAFANEWGAAIYDMEQKYKHQCVDGHWINSKRKCYDNEHQGISPRVVTIDITEFRDLERAMMDALVAEGMSPKWWLHLRGNSEHDLRTFPDGNVYESRKGLWVKIRPADPSDKEPSSQIDDR